jgi:predicted nucleic acid-binding protein
LPDFSYAPNQAVALQLPHIARKHNPTNYDAYLELAVRSRLPLATADKALIRAASELKLKLLSHS